MLQSPKTSHSSKIAGRYKSPGPRTTVLHLCPDLESEETARETVDLAILTQRSGWRALIASGGGSLVNDSERAAVRHARIPLNKDGWFANWQKRLRLEALVQKEHPALIHAHDIKTLPYAYALSRIHRTPIIADITQPFPDSPQRQKLFANLKQISHAIRIPSAFMGDYLYRTYNLSPENLYHVPPGIDLRWFNAGSISPERLQALSHLWRLPELASVVLVPLPLTEGAGHKTFLQAMARLKEDNIFAVLVGRYASDAPTMNHDLETWVHELGLEGKVIIPEFCHDWPAACWLSNVVVAPNSAARGQSLALLAAQAMGRPVIVTDCGANTEMARHGETAWIVPSDNPALLGDALHEAIHLSTEQRLTLADNTRHFIAETFPQSQWFNEIVEIYEKLLAHPIQSTRVA